MKKLIIFSCILFCYQFTLSQNITSDILCANFTESISDSLDTRGKYFMYKKHIIKPLSNIPKEKRIIILEKLRSDCKEFNNFFKVDNSSIKIEPINEKESLNDLLKRNTSTPWTKEEIIIETAKCSNSSKENTYDICKKSVSELSLHMDYKIYKSLTEYQQGRLIGKISRYLNQ